MDSKEVLYEERKCFRYVIPPHLQFSSDFPGELDALAGSRGVLGYIVEARVNEYDSATAAASHHEDKKKKYLLQSCDEEAGLTFSSQDAPIALPNTEDWDETTDENVRKKVVLVGNSTQPSQFKKDETPQRAHSMLAVPNRIRTDDIMLQTEVATTTNTGQVSEEIRNKIVAFDNHYDQLANARALKTTFDKEIGAAALEIAKASCRTQAAQNQVNRLLAKGFHPGLRELCLFYGISKISPEEYGKRGKSAFCTALLQVFEKMCPAQYYDQIKEPLKLVLPNAFRKFSMHLLIVNVPGDVKLTIGNSWYFGDDADIVLDLEASASSAPTNEASRLVSVTNWLAQGPSPSKCVMDWASTIDEANFKQFPLLEFDPKAGCVNDEKSKFHGMRPPRTFTEWISQLYFIILTTFASISTNALTAAENGLVHRCRKAADSMREGSKTLLEIITRTFLKSAGVEGSFYGTNQFWKVMGDQKGHVGETSQFRLALLFTQRVRRNYKILEKKRAVVGRELSVKKMFSRIPKSRDRPLIADINEDDFNVDSA